MQVLASSFYVGNFGKSAKSSVFQIINPLVCRGGVWINGPNIGLNGAL